jgi:hypothetical protein
MWSEGRPRVEAVEPAEVEGSGSVEGAVRPENMLAKAVQSMAGAGCWGAVYPENRWGPEEGAAAGTAEGARLGRTMRRRRRRAIRQQKEP